MVVLTLCICTVVLQLQAERQEYGQEPRAKGSLKISIVYDIWLLELIFMSVLTPTSLTYSLFSFSTSRVPDFCQFSFAGFCRCDRQNPACLSHTLCTLYHSTFPTLYISTFFQQLFYFLIWNPVTDIS